MKVPTGFVEALDAAASQRHQSASEFVRQCILRELQRDGGRLAYSEGLKG
jgi:hypothetical protein